jgi:hypothetical protein
MPLAAEKLSRSTRVHLPRNDGIMLDREGEMAVCCHSEPRQPGSSPRIFSSIVLVRHFNHFGKGLFSFARVLDPIWVWKPASHFFGSRNLVSSPPS